MTYASEYHLPFALNSYYSKTPFRGTLYKGKVFSETDTVPLIEVLLYVHLDLSNIHNHILCTSHVVRAPLQTWRAIAYTHENSSQYSRLAHSVSIGRRNSGQNLALWQAVLYLVMKTLALNENTSGRLLKLSLYDCNDIDNNKQITTKWIYSAWCLERGARKNFDGDQISWAVISSVDICTFDLFSIHICIYVKSAEMCMIVRAGETSYVDWIRNLNWIKLN